MNYTSSYEYVFEEFTDVREELFNIARIFHVEDSVEHLKSRMMGTLENKIFFSDMVISEKDKNTVVLDSLQYNGKKYCVEIPINFSFFKDNASTYPRPSIAQDCTIINETTKETIRIWGGIEGKEVFDEEANYNSAQILDQVNEWENFNIKDFTQNVYICRTNEECRQVIRGELTVFSDKRRYDVFVLRYLSSEEYINICIGVKSSMGDKCEYYRKMLKNIKIFKKDKSQESRPLYLSSIEIKELSEKENMAEAFEYFESHKNELNLPFMLSFRKRFKTLICEPGANIFDKYSRNYFFYDYSEPSFMDFIECTLMDKVWEHKGQYILYDSSYIVVTDYCVIFSDLGNGYVKILLNLDYSSNICEYS